MAVAETPTETLARLVKPDAKRPDGSVVELVASLRKFGGINDVAALPRTADGWRSACDKTAPLAVEGRITNHMFFAGCEPGVRAIVLCFDDARDMRGVKAEFTINGFPMTIHDIDIFCIMHHITDHRWVPIIRHMPLNYFTEWRLTFTRPEGAAPCIVRVVSDIPPNRPEINMLAWGDSKPLCGIVDVNLESTIMLGTQKSIYDAFRMGVGAVYFHALDFGRIRGRVRVSVDTHSCVFDLDCLRAGPAGAEYIQNSVQPLCDYLLPELVNTIVAPYLAPQYGSFDVERAIYCLPFGDPREGSTIPLASWVNASRGSPHVTLQIDLDSDPYEASAPIVIGTFAYNTYLTTEGMYTHRFSN